MFTQTHTRACHLMVRIAPRTSSAELLHAACASCNDRRLSSVRRMHTATLSTCTMCIEPRRIPHIHASNPRIYASVLPWLSCSRKKSMTDYMYIIYIHTHTYIHVFEHKRVACAFHKLFCKDKHGWEAKTMSVCMTCCACLRAHTPSYVTCMHDIDNWWSWEH